MQNGNCLALNTYRFAMQKIKCLLLLFLVCNTFNVFSQQKIVLLNGNEIEIESYKQDDIYISYKKTNDRHKKTRIIEKYDVFSIKEADGTESVIFKGDSLTFTVAEAKNYIRGEQAARQFYHKPFNKWAAGIFGAGTSLLSFYSLPVPMLYGVIIGRFDPKKMQIPSGYDAPYSSTEEYRLGYNKKARNMKIQESLKWGYIGLSVGLASFIIYGFSAH